MIDVTDFERIESLNMGSIYLRFARICQMLMLALLDFERVALLAMPKTRRREV